jgi:PDZ domain-containing protein
LGLGFIFAGSVLWFTPTAWYITAPGAAIDTSRLIDVPGGQPHRGKLYMMVVTTQPANLFWYVYAKADRRAILETPAQFLGNVEDYSKYVELTRQMMADSQKTAEAIALHLAGYGKGVTTNGVKVFDLTTDSPSKGLLTKDDVIIGIDGKPVTNQAELRAILTATAPGTRVQVRIRRGSAEQTVAVTTYENPSNKGSAALGVLIMDNLVYDVPVAVNIHAGAITGPSAGLMFTLQIIDQLTPGGITGGLKVAGTGTIEPDGSIGEIGGIQQKVYAAETAGASVFFAPRGNYEEARKVATRVELVPVDKVTDALQWLQAHRPKGGA